MESELAKLIPKGRVLIIGGSGGIAVTLEYGSLPSSDHIIELTQVQFDIRMIFHTNGIIIDE